MNTPEHDPTQTDAPGAKPDAEAKAAPRKKAAPKRTLFFAPEAKPGSMFAPAARRGDLLAALLSAAAMALFYLFRSPMWALPGASAAVASVVAGIDPPASATQIPAVAAARLLLPLATGPGCAVAVSNALLTAAACGAFFLALLSLFHVYLRPSLLAEDVRHGEFQAVFLPRFGAAAGTLLWGVSPAALRLAAGQAPDAAVVFTMTAAFALLLHAQVADRFGAILAGAALAGVAAGVHPVAVFALPLALVPVVIHSVMTESERNPALTIAAGFSAAAAGALASAALASAAFAAASPAGLGIASAAKALVAHLAEMARATIGSERALGMDPAAARFVPALSVVPFVGWLFAARTSLAEREGRISLHVFNVAVLAVSALCAVGTGFSPLTAAAGLAPEAPAAALCAATFAYALVACYVQSLYFFSENVFPPKSESELRTGYAIRWTIVATGALVASAAALSSARNAPTRASSLWRFLADASLDSLDGHNCLEVSRETRPLLRLRAAERGVPLTFYPDDLPFPAGAGDPALVASDSDPGAWEDAGLPSRPSGILFVGLAPDADPDPARAAEGWKRLAAEATRRIRRARKSGGPTAALAARLLGARVASAGAELVRETARAGMPGRATSLLAETRSFAPNSPMVALASVSILRQGAPARDFAALSAATERGGPGLAGLAEMSLALARPVDLAAEAFLAPGFVRIGAPKRAVAVLERSESSFADLTAEDRAIVVSALGRAKLALGDREGARAAFEKAMAISGGSNPQAAFALAEVMAPAPPDDDAEAARIARLEVLGASREAILASRLRAMEARGIPVSARMLLDKEIRNDSHNPTLYLMRFERLLDALAAAPDDDRRRWSEAAAEDLVKLRDDPGPWSARIALGSARLWLLEGQTDLARAELASEAIVRPGDPLILAPLVALDGAIGMPEARAEHLAALRRVDPAAAEAAAAAEPDPDALLRLSLEEELFAAFPADRQDAEFEGAAAVASLNPEKTHAALLRAFATAALSDRP